MRNGQAFVVICPHRPDLMGQPLLGHVGWGYEYPDGSWCIGAVEGPDWQGSYNGFWARRMPDIRAALMYFSEMGSKLGAEYDFYKLLTVSDGITPNWQSADRVVAWVRDQEYNLVGRNCMNSTYDVLRAFANGAYNGAQLPHPDRNWIPNGWFNAIQTKEYYKLPPVTYELAGHGSTPVSDLKLESNPMPPEWRVGEVLLLEQNQPQWDRVEFIEPVAKSHVV